MNEETRELLERIVREADEYQPTHRQTIKRLAWRRSIRTTSFEGSVQEALIDIVYRLTGERIRP